MFLNELVDMPWQVCAIGAVLIFLKMKSFSKKVFPRQDVCLPHGHLRTFVKWGL